MADAKTDETAVVIRVLRAEDAPRLTRCIERCYGDSYVGEAFYDPAELRARILDGRLRSVVAVAASGEVVGHMGLTRRHADAATADAGNTVVDPRYRSQKLALRMGVHLLELSREEGLLGFHHYPTTAHGIIQRLAIAGGGIETGVMLEYIPAGTDYRGLGEGAREARLAVVVIYQPIAAAPAREVYLPRRYRERLASIYCRSGFARTSLEPAAALPASASQLDARLEARRGLLRVEIARVGEDVRERVDAETRATDAELIHADVSLADPGVDLAVEALRRSGFFFSALLPEYANGDVLRLQRLRDEGAARLPELATAEARSILDFALADRASGGMTTRAPDRTD